MVPPWALPLLCLSKRVHSIFLLRLFNDGPAVLLAHAGAAALLSRRPRLAVLLFSAATSVKMSVLLMAPSVLVVLLKARHHATQMMRQPLSMHTGTHISALGCLQAGCHPQGDYRAGTV